MATSERSPQAGPSHARLTFAHERTDAFINAALSDGVKERILAADPQAARALNTLGVYYRTPATLSDVASKVLPYRVKRIEQEEQKTSDVEPEGESETADVESEKVPVTVERARQIRNEALKLLWTYSSPVTKEAFPLATIPKDKPTASLTRERMSESNGGVSNQIAAFITQGLTFEEIKKAGFSTGQIAKARITLEKRGVTVPRARERRILVELHSLREGLQKADVLPPTIAQDILNRVDRGYLNRDRSERNPTLISLVSLARSAGFSFAERDLQPFFNALRSANIPFGHIMRKVNSGGKEIEQHYYFVPTSLRNRVVRALRSDPDLDKFRRDNPGRIRR